MIPASVASSQYLQCSPWYWLDATEAGIAKPTTHSLRLCAGLKTMCDFATRRIAQADSGVVAARPRGPSIRKGVSLF